MLRMSFEGFEFAFECFEFGSNDSNLFRTFRICIRMVEFLSSGLNFDSNASLPFQML